MTSISRSSAPMCTDDPSARAFEEEAAAKLEASRRTAALDPPLEADALGNGLVEVLSSGILGGLRVVTEKVLTGAGEVALVMAREVAKEAAKKVVKEEAWKLVDAPIVPAEPAVDPCVEAPYVVICG